MSKDQVIKMEGTITQSNGNSNFVVELQNGMEIKCTICGKMRQNYIRVMPGDMVEVEISPYDITRGRISKRLKSGMQNNTTVFHKKKK